MPGDGEEVRDEYDADVEYFIAGDAAETELKTLWHLVVQVSRGHIEFSTGRPPIVI